MKKKILLLSAYDVASHQYWRLGLEHNLLDYDWTILTLPARHFSWRIRSNSLTWAFNEQEILKDSYDLIIATSMTDLSSLRGFTPHLSSIPTIVYCHENQFSFPSTDAQQNLLESQVLSIYTLLCADKVLFNSDFNRQSFLAGARALLKRFPDHVPNQLVESIQNKSAVLPVPIDTPILEDRVEKNKIFTITWNHRWEYDKGIELLYSILKNLAHRNITFSINIVGQQFRQTPETFDKIKRLLVDNSITGEFGFIKEKNTYYKLLKESHLVLSTSNQEFQGLAIMEAVFCDCAPILPKRLSYPEFFPKSALYEPSPDNLEKESIAATNLILEHYEIFMKGESLSKDKIKDELPSWKNKKAEYQSLIDSLFI